jgi:hypothetical protein
MDAEQAIEKIKEIRRQGRLARIFLDGRDCGAYRPAEAAAAVREADATRELITFDVTASHR